MAHLRVTEVPKPLYCNPHNSAHFSVRPFAPGQSSSATVTAMQPAQQFASSIVRRLFAGLKNPKSAVTVSEDVMQGYIAAAYNAGYAAAVDQEFADVMADLDPEMGSPRMNPLRLVMSVTNGVAKLECGHVIVFMHDSLPAVGAEKHCVQCGHQGSR